jgi:predicted methyltransferase
MEKIKLLFQHRIRFALLVLLNFSVIAIARMQSASAQDDASAAAALKAAIAGPQRSDANKARDKYRHPFETLTFFGIKPDMTVVEISPGTGWYTEILAPFLKDHGKLYEAVGGGAGAKTFNEKLKIDPAVYGQVIVTTLQPPAETDIAPAGTADMVLTFRNVHDWLPRGTTQDYFKAFYRALKPGGILGITDHRADPSQPQDPNAKNGYVRQDYMIQLAEQAGFKLAGTSEINANPKDLRDHPVWNLPPTLREGEKDRAKYLAIGESDRMTLKFTKPATAN